MRLPAAAVIAPEELRDYVLSPTHPDGRAKAAYLGRIGYTQSDWRRLDADLREQILSRDAEPAVPTGQSMPRLVTVIPVEKR